MFIRQAELLEGLSAEAKGVIDRSKTKRDWKAGAWVFQVDEEAQHFFIIETGRMDLLLGKQETLRFLVDYPGEIFGWSALIKPHRYLGSALCMTDCTASMVPREAIDEISKEYPPDGVLIYRNLAAILGQRLIEAYRDREDGPKQVAYGG